MFTLEKPTYREFKTPILIICFNRPQCIELQLASLREVKPKKIYISCDGPRLEKDDGLKIEEVKKTYLKGIDWSCDVQTNFHEANQGCSLGPINAMRWFFQHEEQGIILEDDIIPNRDFYDFCFLMLTHFKKDKKILSVSGCTLGYEHEEDYVFSSKIMNMWGWATWRDRFEKIDFNLNSWKTKKNKNLFLHKRLNHNILDYDKGWVQHWNDIFDKTISSKNLTWWDYQFIYNQIESNLLSIYPSKNLVLNIGFGEDATHTVENDHFISKLETKSLNWPLKINTKKPDAIFYNKFIKQIWSFYTRPNWKYYLGKILKTIRFKR
jgi:hypothetical protein